MASRSVVLRRGNLRTRALTALILAPLALLAVIAGGIPLHLLILLTAALAVREWVRLTGSDALVPTLEIGLCLITVALLVFALAGPVSGLLVLAGGTVILAWAGRAAGGVDGLLTAFGLLYIGLSSMAVLWLRDRPNDGGGLLIWLLIIVWATDIFGFVAGRLLGGPKLAPTISPNKTWSGLAGAVIGAALAGFLAALAWGALRPGTAAAVAGALALVAQAGDLFESGLKRRYGVKDSGRLIPGHGGVLDRIDGLIAAALALALIQLGFGAAGAWW